MDKVLDDVLFVLVVLTAIGVALVIYYAMGGPVPPWVFVIIVQAGVNLGLGKFIWSSTMFASHDDTQEDNTTKQLKL